MKGTRGVLWIGRCGTRGRSPLHELDASSSVCLSKLCPHWAWPQAQVHRGLQLRKPKDTHAQFVGEAPAPPPARATH